MGATRLVAQVQAFGEALDESPEMLSILALQAVRLHDDLVSLAKRLNAELDAWMCQNLGGVCRFERLSRRTAGPSRRHCILKHAADR